MYLKVRKERAEETRRKLLADGKLDIARNVCREGDYVLFPVKSKVEGGKIVEYDGGKRTLKPRSLKEALAGRLTEEEIAMLPTAYDVIGDIAVLELDEGLAKKRRVIGEALIRTFRNIKVVAAKVERVSGEYRVPGVEVVAGEERTETQHREHGCVLKLDVAKAYFSPRLGSERMRVVGQMRDGERVLVMFAGVGPYAILAARKANADVTAVELNPDAVKYLRWNVLRNGVEVDVVEGDVRVVVPNLGLFDRIIMPLPKQADTFLDVAVNAIKEEGVIHCYTFAANTLEATGHLAETIGSLGRRARILDAVPCGTYNPRIKRICVDFKVE